MKVAFLDRDGVINKEKHYLYKIEEFEYTEKCLEGLKGLRQLGYEIIVVTNQAGIARGIYDQSDYQKLTDWYLKDLKKKGIDILDVIHCPHHPDGTVLEYKKVCYCRKPAPGMILTMKDKHNINLNKSILIGDKLSDIEAAENAGVGDAILVKSGHAINYEAIPEGLVIMENLFFSYLYIANHGTN